MSIYMYFLLFLIYSVFGWLVEVVSVYFCEGHFVNRGFLMGPYCPIFGLGGLLCYLLLRRYLEDPFVLLIMAILIFSLLEYVTSFFMEKLFHARWWDYSQMKFNINGRVCLEIIIPFGLLGCFAMYILNPILIKMLQAIPETLGMIVAIVLFIWFIIDICISLKVIINFKNVAFAMYKDNTEEITKKVREVLSKKSILNRRLVESFSKLKITEKIKIKDKKKKNEE